ncbi:hypothetical protein ONA70_32935, partial [Micromonospora yasonensis]|nr:hypothetical protein [Micromonospora yasonensis]
MTASTAALSLKSTPRAVSSAASCLAGPQAESPVEGDVDRKVVRSLADIFVDYGRGYITPGLLAWSPGWVALFLGDWLPRKAFLDDAQREVLPEAFRRWLRFALHRREADAEWVEPVGPPSA